MKKTDYSNHLLGQEISGITQIHEQLALIDSLKAITRSLGVNASKVTILFGCIMTENGTQYDQTAGAVVYNDEIYFVDAFSGNHATNIPVYQFVNIPVGPNVRFGDLQYRQVHVDHKMELVMAVAASGEEDWDSVDLLKDKIYGLIGVQSAIQSYTDAAIAALVDTSPATLDTLNELAAALGDDPNFATTITNAIASKIAISAIVNSLTSTATNAPLSAAQGKNLNDNMGGLKFSSTSIGNWDMTTGTKLLTYPPNVNISNIRSIQLLIIVDNESPFNGDLRYDFASHGGVITPRNGDIHLEPISTLFDSTTFFNSPSYNRGYLVISYF